MFTGLVQSLAAVAEVRDEPPGKRLTITAPDVAARVQLGASVAVNGCCLTVIERDAQSVQFQAGPETLSRTNLGLLRVGDVVNLETSLCAGDPLGGHFVTGHVDALGTVEKLIQHGEWTDVWVLVPPSLVRQMASKGSVAVDGVSLTLVEVLDDRFSVQLIPHTLAVTTLGRRNVGDRVNVETDLLAKYVQKAFGPLPRG